MEFESDVIQLERIERFQKIDGEPATVNKLQELPFRCVLMKVVLMTVS